MNRLPIPLALLLMACAALSFGKKSSAEGEPETQKSRPGESQQQAADRAKLSAILRRHMVQPDLGMSLLPRTYRPQASQWESAEKSRYQSLLAASSYDVLVLPFQVQGFAFDRSTRSLMSIRLASAIAQSGGLRVPDPYLVMGALGESRRRFDVEEVHKLAVRLGAKRIVWAFAGHDRKNHMSLRVQFEDKGGGDYFGPEAMNEPYKIDNIDFTDANPPIEAYERVLPEMVRGLGFTLAPLKPKRSSQYDAAVLPATPLGMTSSQSDPARDAFSFQILAALTPSSAERTRERFVEKSMLAILSLSEDSSDYRLLKARSFMLMGLRPAALQVLGKPKNEEEKALLAALNGNLPDMAAATSGVKPKIKRLLAELNLAAIRSAYGVPDAKNATEPLKALSLPGTIWPLLTARAITDPDGWSQQDNLALKEVLDAEFPIQGFTAKSIVSGLASVGTPEKGKNLVDLSAYNHIQQLLAKETAHPCCAADVTNPTTLDYLALIDAIAFDNLARRVRFYNSIQGNPSEALSQLSQMESVYKGHPHVALLRAQVESALANKNEGAAKEGLQRSAYANGFDAYYQAQGQTADAADAFDFLIQTERTDFGYLNNIYVGDYPFRSFYPTWELSSMDLDLGNARAGLRNSTFDTMPVYRLYSSIEFIQHKHAEMNEELKSLKGRFSGSPYVTTLRAKISFVMGNTRDAEKYYREAIKMQSAPWDTYKDLFQLLISQGQIKEAAQIAMSYPGFQPGSTENRVGLANAAYQAGANFEWIGEFEMAKPLYKIAADLNTGADSSITAYVRLKLLSGDYPSALGGEFERANRYNAPNAYRNYLAMLHAMGHSKEAWDGFNALISQLTGPQIWESALAGHRIGGAGDQEIVTWARQDSLRSAGELYSYAANYLVLTSTTDRRPGENVTIAIEELERPVWQVADGLDHVVRATRDNSMQFIYGPSAPENSTLPLNVFDRAKKTRVKSDRVYFVEAYRAMRSGDYGVARALLVDASKLYDMTQGSQSYMLPYFAFAASKSRDLTGIEKIIGQFRIEQQGFDYFLAKAVLAGLSGKTDDSLSLLKKALYMRPYADGRPLLSEYQYAEICEWLYEATGKTQFRDIAVDWAKKSQKMKPWHAWAYAMEAKLSTDVRNRRQAIAIAFYLDRNSERLGTIPKPEIDSSVKEFANRNPFLQRTGGAKEKST